ncbi:MAG: CmcI family methyltransferase [Candidatus Neomarinimicrobiota bacterium]
MKRIRPLFNYYLTFPWDKIFQKSIDKIIPNFSQLYQSRDTIVNDKSTELEVNLNQLSSFIIKDLIPTVGISPFPITELLLMSSAVVKLRPDNIFEWGTHLGISARIFNEICIKYNINAIIHSTDLPDDIEHIEHPGDKRGIKVKDLKNVILHQGDGLNTSIDIASKLKGNNKLLFFLDGDHSFESVIRELNGVYNAFPKSYILIHDTFYQSADSGYNIGPYKAVNKFLKEHPNQYKKISTDLGLPGMTLLHTT